MFRLLNDTEIAKAKRDFELKKAAYDVEVQTKVIVSFFVGPIIILWVLELRLFEIMLLVFFLLNMYTELNYIRHSL